MPERDNKRYLVYLPYWVGAFLFLAVVLNLLNRQILTDPEQLVAELETKMAETIRETHNQATSIMMNSEEPNIFRVLSPMVSQNFFLFKDEKMVYWSNNKLVPDYYRLTNHEENTLYDYDQGKYLLLKYEFREVYELFALVELYNDVSISNDYIKNGYNEAIFPVTEGPSLFPANSPNGLPVKYLGETVFNIDFQDAVKARSELLGYFIVLLYFTAFIILGLYVWIRLGKRAQSGEFESSFFIWAGFLVILRYLMFLFEFPDAIIETGLFQSMFFAASRVNPSLGDLLINLLLLLFIIAFFTKFIAHSRLIRLILRSEGIRKQVFSVALIFMGFLFLSYPHLIIQTIYENSQITLDITESTSLTFPKIVAGIIFLISGVSLFLIAHLIIRTIYQLHRTRAGGFLLSLSVSIVLFATVQILSGDHFYISLITGAVFFLLLYFTKIFRRFNHWNYQSFLYLFVLISTVGVLGAYGIYEFESERVRRDMERFANYFLIKNDNLTEYYLFETNQRIEDDIFISTRLASPFLSKDVIIDKIKQVHLGSLFDKYDVGISIYKESNLVAGDSIRNFAWKTPKVVDEFATEYDNIYFLNNASEGIGKRYIDVIGIERRDMVIGYIVLDLKLKKIIPDNVYLELLVDNRFTQPWSGEDFSYVIYENEEVQYSSGNYNYKATFPVKYLSDESPLFLDHLVLSNFDHIGLKDDEGRVVIVGSPTYRTGRILTNFSMLFTVQVAILLAIGVLSSILLFYRRININFSTRIQLYFNLSFFVPMLIVSFVTLSSVNEIFKEEVSREYNKKANNFAQNIALHMENYMLGIINRDDLMNKVLEVSRYANSDVNLFNRFGELVATSRPLIYDKKLLSQYINPLAFNRIIERRNTQWITLENVGDLAYNVSYIAIRSFRTGEFIGVLSVPYFESEEELEKQQINVLSSILNIFTVVLVIFILVSYFVSKGLTFPLRLITSRLSKTNLNQVNEPIDWESDDEIGLMVGEYNRMVLNLEESKSALARSQKEMAWREIAQQVAHEIKNPLTPMKLSLQHLERQLSGKEDESVRKPIKNLLNHIDTLNDIATSFSSFARMPIPENKPFELVEVLDENRTLHKNLDQVSITFDKPLQPITVWGDRKLMSRIFSNLILNAAQSGTEGEQVDIDINVEESGKKVTISISDTGNGIEEDIQGRIFVPNFTTKEKGSGIGLSIAKHGVEHAGGKIWFESELGKGSIFYIELQRVM